MPATRERAEAWERLFWSIFERSTNPIVLLDEHRRIIEANAAACELVEVLRDDVVGRPMDDFIAPEERPRVIADWEPHLHAADWSGERRLLRADGSRVRVEFAARASEVGGRRVAVVVFLCVPCEDEGAQVARHEELTPRELEVLSLVALGNTTPEIAGKLVISPETVRTHVRNAMAKTGAKTRAQLVALALADGHIAA